MVQRIVLGVVSFVLFILPATAAAQVPAKLGYQGRLLRADGAPEAGTVDIRFALFDESTGGVAWWSETQSVALTNGYYSTFLGEVTPLDASLFDGQELYLELTVAGETLAPRQRVASVAYALRASDAVNLAGGTVDASRISVGGQTVIDGSGRLAGSAAYSAGEGLELNGTVLGLVTSCGAGEVLKWDGVSWGCAADDNLILAAGAGIAVSGGSVALGACPAGEVWQSTGAGWICGPAGVPVETDPTVNSLAKAPLGCAAGMVAKATATGWVCDVDNDTPTTWSTLTGMPAGFADGTDDVGLTAETDPSVNALGKATLSCAAGEVAKYSGTGWSCAADDDSRETYVAGDNVVWADDREIAQVELNSGDGYRLQKQVRVVKPGALRVMFEAMISSGNDYWAWKITANGALLTSGAYTSGLDPVNTASVHEYRLYSIDVSGVAAGDMVQVWMKASDGSGGGVGSAGGQNLILRGFRLGAGVPTVEGGPMRAETFLGALANGASIIAANSGSAQFTEVQSTSAAVFEVQTTAPYGVRFKKAGRILFNYDQDVIASGGNYVYTMSRVDSTLVAYTLIRPTGGQWDGMHHGGVYYVEAGQTLSLEWGSSASDITAMDNGLWGRLSILWYGDVQ